MKPFALNGISEINHYTPLHYLPFIARSRRLLGKPSLSDLGFHHSHLRSKSSHHDVKRGFGEYAFLTLDRTPRIVAAKLRAGFPHIGILVPASVIDELEYDLCRYNVAMTRYLRRGNRPGFEESDVNGRYYGSMQVPIARELPDKLAMLKRFAHSETMIEILVRGDVELPSSTKVIVYHDADLEIATHVLNELNVEWEVGKIDPPGVYNRRDSYVESINEFISMSLNNAEWRGNGLEFDNV